MATSLPPGATIVENAHHEDIPIASAHLAENDRHIPTSPQTTNATYAEQLRRKISMIDGVMKNISRPTSRRKSLTSEILRDGRMATTRRI